jgi:hypothetical protein
VSRNPLITTYLKMRRCFSVLSEPANFSVTPLGHVGVLRRRLGQFRNQQSHKRFVALFQLRELPAEALDTENTIFMGVYNRTDTEHRWRYKYA